MNISNEISLINKAVHEFGPAKSIADCASLKNFTPVKLASDAIYRTDTPDIFQKSDIATMSKETFKKAKKLVMSTITGKEPKESLVLVQDDKIIHHIVGDKTNVAVGSEAKQLIHNPLNKIISLHSHPKLQNGTTTPISIADCESLINQEGVFSEYVINSKGEYSMLEKIPGQFKAREPLCYDKEFEDFHKKFRFALSELLSGEEKSDYINILNKLYSDGLNSYEHMETTQKYDNFMDILLQKSGLAQRIDDFWQNNAHKLGLRYKTNFSF